jgi:hypothetical protein
MLEDSQMQTFFHPVEYCDLQVGLQCCLLWLAIQCASTIPKTLFSMFQCWFPRINCDPLYLPHSV